MFLSAILAAAFPYVTGTVLGMPVPISDGAPGPGRGLWLEDGKLYVLSNRELFVYSVRNDPLHPKLLGRADGVLGGRQVVAQGGIAYVSARERGMWIVDCRDPGSMRVLSRYDSIGLGTGVDVAGDVCMLTETGNGVEFIDVSDPEHPQHICIRKTDESQSVLYRDGFVYSGEWASAHLTVLDARDMANVHEVARCDFHGTGDGLWKSGNLLYCATGRDSAHVAGCAPGDRKGPGLDIIDVSNPLEPRSVSRISYAPGFCRRKIDSWILRVSGDLLLSAQTCQGLYAVDGMSGTEDCPGGAVSSVAIGDGAVYASGPDFVPVAIPCRRAKYAPVRRGAPPRNVKWRDPYPEPPADFARWRPPFSSRGLVRECAVKGDVCYAACSDGGLYALRFGKGGAIEQLGKLPPEKAFDVAVHGDRLYVAEGMKGWAIYRILGDSRLEEIGRHVRKDELARDVWAYADGWAVFSNRARCHLMDVSDPTAPKYLLSVQNQAGWNKYMCAGLLGGRYLACNSALKYVEWVDLAAKPPKVNIALDSRIGASAGICAFGDKALVCDQGVFALVEPGSDGPWSFREIGSGGIPRSNGRLVAQSLLNGKVALHDFRDAGSPACLGKWNLKSFTGPCSFWRGRLVVPGGYLGVLLQK